MSKLKLTAVKGIDSAKAKLLKASKISSVTKLMNCSLYELCLTLGIEEILAITLKSNAKHAIYSTLDKKKDSKTKKKKTKRLTKLKELKI